MTLDLAVYPGSSGLNESQKAKSTNIFADYKSQSCRTLADQSSLRRRQRDGGHARLRQVRKAIRRAGIDPRSVVLEPYFANGDPSAPLRLSYLQFVAKPPDCPDWSENIGRDPQNMPWPNMGCATQRNLAASVADARDLLGPRGETPRPGERRDTVWGKYVKGESTGSNMVACASVPSGARDASESKSEPTNDERRSIFAELRPRKANASLSARATKPRRGAARTSSPARQHSGLLRGPGLPPR